MKDKAEGVFRKPIQAWLSKEDRRKVSYRGFGSPATFAKMRKLGIRIPPDVMLYPETTLQSVHRLNSISQADLERGVKKALKDRQIRLSHLSKELGYCSTVINQALSLGNFSARLYAGISKKLGTDLFVAVKEAVGGGVPKPVTRETPTQQACGMAYREGFEKALSMLGEGVSWIVLEAERDKLGSDEQILLSGFVVSGRGSQHVATSHESRDERLATRDGFEKALEMVKGQSWPEIEEYRRNLKEVAVNG